MVKDDRTSVDAIACIACEGRRSERMNERRITRCITCLYDVCDGLTVAQSENEREPNEWMDVSCCCRCKSEGERNDVMWTTDGRHIRIKQQAGNSFIQRTKHMHRSHIASDEQFTIRRDIKYITQNIAGIMTERRSLTSYTVCYTHRNPQRLTRTASEGERRPTSYAHTHHPCIACIAASKQRQKFDRCECTAFTKYITRCIKEWAKCLLGV